MLYTIADGVKPWLSAKKLDFIDSDWGLPDYGYRLSQDFKFEERCRPFTLPRLHLIWKFVFMFIRYMWTWIKLRVKGRKMFIDNFDLCPWKPIYGYWYCDVTGVPIGGLGCGTIGRGYRGEFCRFQLVPGMYTFESVAADQFIVNIRRHGQTIYQNVLSVHDAPKSGLSSWQWRFPKQRALYHALYPRAWTVYEIVECSVTLVCRQVSPIFPHDYKDTSLPTAVFVWTAYNRSSEPLDISVTFTFQSGPRVRGDDGSPVRCTSFDHDSHDTTPYTKVSGVTLSRSLRGMPCTYAVSAACLDGVDVSYMLAFDPDSSGSGLWQDLLEDGRLDSNGSTFEASANENVACAVCASRCVQPGSSGNVDFCLAWDMPVIQFGHGVRKYYRRYTKFFGYGGKSAPLLVHYALTNYADWERKIDAWQQPILNDSSLPSWYKSALFNELYFVSDGGTVWVQPAEQGGEPVDSVPALVKDIGHFAYLEGHEYRMYNTYDVHHYASFALIHLWPQLQLSLQYDIAKAITKRQDERVRFCMSGTVDVVKAPNCVPHDVGDPDDEPWDRVNAYTIHPTQEWKDLNTKFVLQVYRDYVFTKNEQYLAHMYPLVKLILEQCLRWDVDLDGVIENSSFADQTYDAWSMEGASAYCGGIWLAALKVFCLMAERLKQTDDRQRFGTILDRGRVSFERKLWTGEYYKYDDSRSSHHDSIMASQLDGHWYLRASDVSDYEVFPRDHVVSALKCVFRNNVLPYGGGTLGAINGARPNNGGKDTDGLQSEEFWTGICYALAACMLHEGLLEEGWQTAYGPYHTCWERYGLAFQTPEAYYDDYRYRSLGYMRPLSIWAMQCALERGRQQQLPGNTRADA